MGYLNVHPSKDVIPRAQRYHGNLYLINNMENMVVFLDLELFAFFIFSCSRNAQVIFVEKQQLKFNSFKILNIYILFILYQTRLSRVLL